MKFLKQHEINNRYVTNFTLEKVLQGLDKNIFDLSVAGKSVLQKNIYRINFGTGDFKILLWSQMHGNESTTTRAVFNFLNSVGSQSEILKFFTFTFLPILNPDGAEAFTRVNANNVDLNRDSDQLTQPESKLLRGIFDDFKPDLALNMHDQRSIFAAGDTNNPATLSFLAPAYNDSCDINDTRMFAMQLIASIRSTIAPTMVQNIGRFDDAFNINCIGDMFTYLNVPTILFEAGFSVNDYQRTVAQNLVEGCLNSLLTSIMTSDYKKFTVNEYLSIPENTKNFVDIITSNFTTDNCNVSNTLPIVFKEELINNEIVLVPTIDYDSAPNFKYGHLYLDCAQKTININDDLTEVLKNLTIS